MQQSIAYLEIKNTSATNLPLKITLTKALAQEILSRHEGGREPVYEVCEHFMNLFNLGKYEPDDSIPILIDFDTDELIDGAHKLVGFIWSNLDAAEFCICFTNES